MREMRFRARLCACAAASLLCLYAFAAGDSRTRERLLLDFGWRFHLGNEWGIAQDLAKADTGRGPADGSFHDADWRMVNLPHDWVIELPFDPKANGSPGFKPVGPDFPTNSVAWYRRTFELPKTDAARRLWLEFDGVFRDCVVFVNGWCVGHHESGYSSFRYDITDVANCGGRNILAVKVDASQTEGWFYEGAGIYRHVWLVKTAPVAVAPDGTFVFSRFKNNVPEGPAESGVFRARLSATEGMLTNASVVLRFGRIDEDGWVYVNGQKVGESHDWQEKPRFDVKPFLRAGENTIAVAVANRYGPGGINLGVALETRQTPPPPQWRRSVFNGLAQLIVQSTRQPGEIKLKATADGLRSTTATLESKPCVLRLQVP